MLRRAAVSGAFIRGTDRELMPIDPLCLELLRLPPDAIHAPVKEVGRFREVDDVIEPRRVPGQLRQAIPDVAAEIELLRPELREGRRCPVAACRRNEAIPLRE